MENPIRQFETWLEEARQAAGLQFPNAVALATADHMGRPSLRMVLLKQVSDEGFVFFTNHESRKGRELAANPHAALCFYWDSMGRQVRVEGPVERVSQLESERYFHTRPRQSQLGAWASRQSQEISSRDVLLERVKEMEERFPGDVPLPEFWGGYLLKPARMEFWQQGEFRLHDRRVFEREAGGDTWKTKFLSP